MHVYTLYIHTVCTYFIARVLKLHVCRSVPREFWEPAWRGENQYDPWAALPSFKTISCFLRDSCICATFSLSFSPFQKSPQTYLQRKNTRIHARTEKHSNHGHIISIVAFRCTTCSGDSICVSCYIIALYHLMCEKFSLLYSSFSSKKLLWHGKSLYFVFPLQQNGFIVYH